MTNIYKVVFKVTGREDKYEVVLVEATSRKKAIKKAYRSKMRYYKHILCPEAKIIGLVQVSEYWLEQVNFFIQRGWCM